MKFTVSATHPADVKGDCLILPVFAKNKLAASTEAVDTRSRGKIREFLKTGDFEGKSKQTAWLYNLPYIDCNRILLLGCGKPDDIDRAAFKALCESAAKALKEKSVTRANACLSDLKNNHLGQKAIGTLAPIAFGNSCYQFDDYKSKPAKTKNIARITLLVEQKDAVSDLREAAQIGMAIAAGMAMTRDLANTPPNVCHPTWLAEQAQNLAGEHPDLTVKIVEEEEMREMNMGAFLSVTAGTEQPAKLICMEYNGTGDKDSKPVVLVGKGITFDTGGISLKPGAAMDEMKFDMGGAASVFGTMKACLELGAKVHLIGVVAAAENMPDGKASRPGDIVTTMSGQTVEILNTDAEGRLVLCDALTYVARYEPDVVIDIATLTGACIVALGHQMTGLMSNDKKLSRKLRKAGKKLDDRAWPLPLDKVYDEQLKSNFADIPNIGTPGAGTVVAASFLSRFTEDYRWAHLDIAGTAWQGGSAKGATGRPVPLLTQYVLHHFA